MPPFRQQAGLGEDSPQWQPPSYVLEGSDENEWEPPDYVKPAEPPKKPSAFSRIKEAVLHPKPYNPATGKPTEIPPKAPLPNLSSEERIRAANELQDPGQGDYFARHPEKPVEPGNINLYKQPRVKNPEGGTSTVYSRSYNLDGKETLLPSVTPDGRFLKTDDEVINEYKKTGRHLGKFNTPDEASRYAEQLHKDYESGKYEKEPQKSVMDRFLEGVTSVPKSIYETVNTIGKRGAEQLRQGDIHGAFETVTSPLMGPMEAINQRLLEGKKPVEATQSDAQDEAVSQVLGMAGLPGKEAIEAYRQGDYAKLTGMGLTAAVVAGAFHKVGELGNRPELPIRQTGIPNRFRSEEVPYRAGEVPIRAEEPPIRRPNLPAEFSTAEDVLPETGQPPISRGKSAEELSYEIAQNRFNMGKELPTEEQVNKAFVNPFEKKLTEWKPPEYAQPTEAKAKTPIEQFYEENPTAKEGGGVFGVAEGRTTGKFKEGKGGLSSIWKPPKYAEPQAARTEGGKLAIGADVKSLGKVLGTSLYKGDIAPIATKELLQNSIDAVRHLGEKGKIDVEFNREDGTIHVKDNGKGLTRQELESVFTDLGASGKRQDVEAAGGFGLAKAAPLLGGNKVEVKSITQGSDGLFHEHSFEGTPDELLEGVDIKHRVVPIRRGIQDGVNKTIMPETGTSVKVHVPKDSEFYQAKDFVNKLSQHSPDVKSQIRVADMYSSGSKPEQHYVPATKGGRAVLTTLDTPSATVELSIPKTSTYGARSYMELHLANNGMFQKTKPMYFDSDIPGLPKSVVIDIKSKVPEGHPDYPFTANREELRGSVQKQVEQYINDNIIKPSLGKRKDELTRLYKGMQEITVGRGEFPNTFGHKIAIYDPQGKITPGEMQEITSNPAFHTLAGNIAGTLKEAMKVAGTPAWANRLEKIGIIFEDKLHGIHIPNPESGKSAILVNPFIAIREMSADNASANILHTILHEMAHVEPQAPGHNESFTIRLGDIYGKFGARRSVEAQDSILNAIADKNTGVYHPEIQKILSTYEESRGRDATTEDLLSGTGIKSGSKGGGEGAVPPSNRPDGEGVVRQAVSKLIDALGNAKEGMQEQEAINKRERARRFAAFSGVKEEGASGAAKSLSKLRGEFEKVEPGKGLGLNPAEADSLFTAVKKARITDGEKARGYTALFKLLNGEGVPQRNELQILDSVFGNGFGDKIIEMHGGIGGIGIKLSKAANTMKSMQNSISLAAPLRHGIGLIARKEFYPAFRDMFKFFGNKEFFDESMNAIENHPDYIKYREAGGFFAKSGSLLNSEEEFLNSYVGSLPRFTGIPQTVGASNRAYTGFLNKLRFDTNRSMWKKAESLGVKMFENVDGEIVPTKEAKAIAKFVNNATGRGDLGSLNKMTNELNLLLWSPRMIASRINMLANPKIYMDLPRGMRREGIKSLLGIAALGTVIDTLAVYGGAKVSTNILSTDYGKARFGTKLIDPWGGPQQYIVGAARFLAGKTDIPRPSTRLEIAGRFFANKESPAASLAHMILTSKPTKGGEPGDITTEYGQKTSVEREVVNRFTPIFIQDLENLVESEPDWSEDIGLTAAMVGASIAGMAQEYPEKKTGGLGFRKMKPTIR